MRKSFVPLARVLVLIYFIFGTKGGSNCKLSTVGVVYKEENIGIKFLF